MSTASSTNALAQASGAVIQETKQPEKSVAWVEKLKGIVEDFRATGSITDAEGKLYLDSKEVSTVIRAVGIYPTEAQMKKFLEEMEADTVSNAVEYEKFFRVLQRLVLDDQFKRDSEEKIFKCFLALDKDKKGYLTKEELIYYMTMDGVGEPLDAEELEEMVASAIDPKEGKMFYEEYVYNLTMDSN